MTRNITRRQFARTVLLTCAGAALAPEVVASLNQRQAVRGVSGKPDTLSQSATPQHLRTIPSTGEKLPSVGMGTWLTFDVPDSANLQNQRARVLQTFFELGGAMIDSSPMYGRSEAVIGYCLDKIDNESALFAASKIWTPLAFDGTTQMADSERLWGVPTMDLMYVHNLLNWDAHLPKLQRWKEEGRIRYVGVSTSHGRRHGELEQVMKTEALDFVQLTYNYDQRATAERLIPLAQDKGIAVIVNRPFGRGHLIRKYQNQPLPGVAKELGCQSWAQYLLLFAVSQPGVTAAIPATTRVDHMTENMGVMQLPIPDEATYRAM